MPFIFYLALNLRLCTLTMLQLPGDSVPQTPAGASLLDPTGGLPWPGPNSTLYIHPVLKWSSS